MDKKRAEWQVRLYTSNYKEAKGTYARIALRGNVSLGYLAQRLEERTGIYRADSTRAIISLMTDLVEEYLLNGYSVTGELGTLVPTVTGLWDFDRIQPTARAKNRAEVRFVQGNRLKEQLKNPLFHETDRRRQGPSLEPVRRFPRNDKWEYVMEPDDLILLEGSRLLMNGDDPTCGFYILDAETEEVKRFFPREEILLNSRGQLMVRLRGELPPGLYRFRVVSQCTTNSVPLKKPLAGDSRVCYRIYAPDEERTIVDEGEKP
ncbi:HU family DNA-binding protein [Parabacteroides sp.]